MVCFFSSSCNISDLSEVSVELMDEILLLSEGGDNIVLLDEEKDLIVSSGKISEDFHGCFCEKIVQGKFSLSYENSKNEVYISPAEMIR